MERLKKLHEEGDLTEREYALAKARVLGEGGPAPVPGQRCHVRAVARAYSTTTRVLP